MTFDEIETITGRSKRSLVNSFSRTRSRLADIGIYINRSRDGVSIKYHEYWQQPEIEGYPRASIEDVTRPGILEEYHKHYNRLTLLYRMPDEGHHTYWCCKCDCGKYKRIRLDSIKNGFIQSCGCYNKEIMLNSYDDLKGQSFGFLQVLELTEYHQNKHSGKIWRCKCNNCGNDNVFMRSDTIKKSISCGCIKSKGEVAIAKALQEHQITYQKEKAFKDLISEKGGAYRFDFYLPDYNCLIEYDGIQHFKADGKYWNTETQLIKTKDADQIKNTWAITHGYNLIRIPFKVKDVKLEDLIPTTSKYLINKEKEI